MNKRQRKKAMRKSWMMVVDGPAAIDNQTGFLSWPVKLIPWPEWDQRFRAIGAAAYGLAPRGPVEVQHG